MVVVYMVKVMDLYYLVTCTVMEMNSLYLTAVEVYLML